jgi:hypothetical protein
VKFFLEFFDNYKYVFWVEGAYAPGSQIEFPVISYSLHPQKSVHSGFPKKISFLYGNVTPIISILFNLSTSNELSVCRKIRKYYWPLFPCDERETLLSKCIENRVHSFLDKF